MHFLVGFGCHALEYGERILAHLAQLLGALDVLGRRHAQHRLQALQLRDGFFGHLADIIGIAEFGSPFGGYDNAVAIVDFQAVRVEPEGFGVILQRNRCNAYHTVPL